MSKRRGLPSNIETRYDSHYVEELFQTDAVKYDFRELDIASIDANDDQPRTDMGDLDGLATSIREKGILEPILVRRVGDRFSIISGERRFRAGLLAHLEVVPSIILDQDDLGTLEIALIENIQRKDLTAFEESEGYRLLIERFNLTHDEVSLKIGKSRNNITETLSICKIPTDLRNKCKDNNITSKSILVEIAREGDPYRMQQLVDVIINEGLSRGEIRAARKLSPADSAQSTKTKPFVFKFKPKSKRFSMNLKFKSEAQPSKEEIIETLEDIIQELREH